MQSMLQIIEENVPEVGFLTCFIKDDKLRLELSLAAKPLIP